ncbi:MAG: endonuclease/exonuclease/phosphatase family protein [Rickettsiales bacterium]|nr:endonuclease/exonuclease/phosphatase family protein [Rickettsiales bacterium]
MDSQATGYIAQLWKYLQLHKSRLCSSPMILCGDLNSSALWDKKRVWNHSKVVSELDEIGFKSLYHELTNEEQGKESRPTLFMHRQIERPYHIDYFFIPELALENSQLTIGDPTTWLELSDHMPLVCDVEEDKLL